MRKSLLRNKSAERLQQISRTRLIILGIFWLLLFLLVIGKLVKVQVLEHHKYMQISNKFKENRITLLAKRGDILDRNGEQLAVDLIHYSLAARPSMMPNKKRVAQQLSKFIPLSAAQILKKLRQSSRFVYLAHKLNPEVATAIRKLKLSGIILERKFSRYNPYKNYAAQVLGFCDFDNRPRGGLELQYDSFLRGKPGWMNVSLDARGNVLPNYEYPQSPPVDGFNLATTMDVVYQGIVEEELEKVVRDNNADEGYAILMDPNSGEVLAMANYPGYDPNRYNEFALENYRNKAISTLFEPGSTFKLVALNLALEQLHMDLNKELVFCENGRYRLFSRTISDYKPFAYLTARQVFEKSSNIGVLKIAQRFKPTEFYRYARDFGFGAPTGIDLPAESEGILHKPDEFSRSSVFYMSIGYEVAVTALQVLNAYAAVANGGFLMRPYVVQKIVDEEGKPVKIMEPEVIRQVISTRTARYVTEVLTGVVDHGTGIHARIPGLKIAGKTGTSQKIDRTTNRYTSKAHIASFVGFFPADDPRFALIVVVNNPRKAYYGGQVAAPAFRNIARRVVGLTNNNDQAPAPAGDFKFVEARSENNYIPDVCNLDIDTAEELLKKNGWKFQVVGKGDWVVKQDPPAGTEIPSRKVKIRIWVKRSEAVNKQIMPNLRGLSLREALRVLSEYQITPEVEGFGKVINQLPRAGRKIGQNTRIKLVCKPA